MRDPSYQPIVEKEVRPPGGVEAAADITRDTRAFSAAIRNRIFSFLRGLINRDFEQALGNLSSTLDAERNSWTAERFQEILDAYHVEHDRICLDPNARNLRNTYVQLADDKRALRVQQMLIDPDEHNDWRAEFEVDLVESRKRGEPSLQLQRMGPLVGAAGPGTIGRTQPGG